jgi:Kef-type K+ transport system membrane component KefB
MHSTLLFLIQCFVLILIPSAVWSGVRRFVPLVVVQILFGIALGPSLLGQVVEQSQDFWFHDEALVRFSGLSWLGVALFTFISGLHLSFEETTGHRRTVVTIGLASFFVPFCLGFVFTLWASIALPGLLGANATPLAFAVCLGLCFGVTALPVLSAILREMGIVRTVMGRTALIAAAFNDILLWIVLAGILVAFGANGRDAVSLLRFLLWAALYAGLLLFAAKPVLAFLLRLTDKAKDRSGDCRLAVVVGWGLLSAVATEAIGLHYLIGAFTAGVIMPREVADEVAERLESLTIVVLLPFFFIATGLKVIITSDFATVGWFLALSIAVAMTGKVLGTAFAARMTGWTWNDSFHLGALMQCKGLMEVVVLTVLHEADLISDLCFSVMVVVALVTTAATMPMAAVFRARSRSKAEAANAHLPDSPAVTESASSRGR